MRRSLLRTLLSSPPAGSVSGPQQTCYTGLTKALPFAHFHFLRENEEQQQGNNNAPQARGLHSSTSPSQRSGFPSPSTLLSKEAGRQLQQARTMAGPPADSENTVPENTWAKFRTDYGVEKKNDLAAGMYALILTFALSAAVHDLHAYPPRVAAMTGFVFYLLYRRKGNA
ncbi:hypothetical protein DUNSADRAFT_1366 [Dunaliella salina]|uniref:Uncharacterized protein n=1 Tax=Dunaliella salina TaxID=3046 RepID=A0ABQ7FXK7_DUNSA|nr:hypothetical protein DUNSADRAFT_1366 [Dunaliella salina]|eukprot:KAF5827089.1 hypothetical protein DUNSADRAFT_1366 [Dunaliella salina]